MTARPQRARRGPGPLIVIVLVVNPTVGLAHDPGLSALDVHVTGTTISATLAVSAADAAFRGSDLEFPPRHAGNSRSDPREDRNSRSDPNVPAVSGDAATRLRDIAADAVRLVVDGERLVPERQHVNSDRGGIRIRFEYPPVRSDRSVRHIVVTSDLPQQLSRGHRELVTVSADGRIVGESVLDAGTRSLSVTVGDPPPSQARQAWSLLTIGIHHILAGYDHLLFLAGLILAAVRVRALLIALTAFTVAHSVSLAVVVLAGVHAPSSIVEPLIAASIAWIGIENLLGRQRRTCWWIVFGFGLIHGFGFAGALTELGFGSSARDVAIALVSFNAGVEAGQLAATSVMLPFVWMIRSRPAWHARLQPACSMIIAAAGIAWLVQRVV
jgi:hydrogenase/urease accessory protein HupE